MTKRFTINLLRDIVESSDEADADDMEMLKKRQRDREQKAREARLDKDNTPVEEGKL